jgi:hypothetical protein
MLDKVFERWYCRLTEAFEGEIALVSYTKSKAGEWTPDSRFF